MTLIAVYKGNVCIGKCDANCYNATQPHCDCICGGKNHGVGKHAAQANTGKMVNEWMDEYKKRKGLGSEVHFTTDEHIFQGSLF